MKKTLHSPWFIVTLAIAGLVAGYSFVALQSEEVFAATECLAEQHAQK